MDLMKNKYLKFSNIEIDNYLITNFTRMFKLHDIPKKFYESKYVLTSEIQDDRFIEGLAFEFWGDSNYWDILMKYNNITNMDLLPVNYDTILVRTEKKISEWLELQKLLNKNMKEADIEIEKQKILDEQIELNEKYRIIKYISKSDLSELLSYLKSVENMVKIDNDILIKVN